MKKNSIQEQIAIIYEIKKQLEQIAKNQKHSVYVTSHKYDADQKFLDDILNNITEFHH